MSDIPKSQVVGVVGPAGFGGSYLTVELIRRGHKVIGISRRPESFGTHENYTPRPVDLDSASQNELVRAFSDADVLVCAYGPHTTGADALTYMPYVETVRRIVLAVQAARVPYFMFMGGAGSLVVPPDSCGGESNVALIDHPGFFYAYRRQLVQSEAHVRYMEDRLGPIGASLRAYRTARLQQEAGETLSAADRDTLESYEANLRRGNDRAVDFIKAARLTLMFFRGNHSFPWTFVSPSPMYRPGPRSGAYEIGVHELPLTGEPNPTANLVEVLDDRLTGITATDLADAMADEIENRKMMYQHWTAVADLSNDTQFPSYLTADALR
ncbi:NAD(P)-binding protein [Aspergillus indologenus CBS 114.80]|uniref:NAD(P)-binding protein n=1 Tax=Aspergillus indologenus CBS 114.80 TaxID=1450541 RepID=A0A2V5HKK2_9EURO|nr:NAD(P)-binding protein [Aspergillus indologenus CBS 114.80]